MNVSALQAIVSAALEELGRQLQEIGSDGPEPWLIDYLFAEDADQGSLPRRALLYLLAQTYGEDEALLRSKLNGLSAQCALFRQLYGDGPVNVLRAPARINILGEHVDYVSYLPTASLPFGSREHDMVMLFRSSETGQVRGASTLEEYSRFSFKLSEGHSPSVGVETKDNWVSYLYSNPLPAPHWGNYVKGAAYFARLKYGERARRGFDFLVNSSIPPSGGASSSSALAVLAGAAIRQVNQIEYQPGELAHDSAQAEWYVGTRGGAMDHTTICLAQRRNAVRIGYAEGQARLVPLPDQRFRWVTFFSHPADKGQAVMLEYNERAAVSRLLIPAIIADWSRSQPDRYTAWRTALESFQSGSVAALDELQRLLYELPATLTLADVARAYADAFRECSLAFPALVRERSDYLLQIRDRALHHLGEVRRVALAERILRDAFRASMAERPAQAHSGMRAIGELLNESHHSLRDLYGVSTPEVERLIEIILSDPHTYGARLMGGGFGGNVLALTTEGHLLALIDRVQSEFYAPRQREGLREGSVMISTPGEGLSMLSIENIWRAAIEHFNTMWWEAERYQHQLRGMLDQLAVEEPAAEVWPVIVAAGKGTRAKETGLNVPKPLAPVLGLPVIKHVLRMLQAAGACSRPPIVIVSLETEPGLREALAGEDVIFVLQPEALGTGNAVLCADEQMRDFLGHALIVWGTQPLARPQTLRRTLKLAALFAEYAMVLPTAVKQKPYAPLLRDHRGQVKASRETHLERAPSTPFGETNIGLFLLKSPKMFAALSDLHRKYWIKSERRYDRPGGELGFPNEMINYLSEHPSGVLASPIADGREAQGIKSLDDIARCERFITEMEREGL